MAHLLTDLAIGSKKANSSGANRQGGDEKIQEKSLNNKESDGILWNPCQDGTAARESLTIFNAEESITKEISDHSTALTSKPNDSNLYKIPENSIDF